MQQMTAFRAARTAAAVVALLLLATGCADKAAKGHTSGDAAKIRKQVGDLRPGELARFPIWEFALDEEGAPGQDEETVRPRPDLTVADPADGLFIARARFIAKDGTRYVGYCRPTPASISDTCSRRSSRPADRSTSGTAPSRRNPVR